MTCECDSKITVNCDQIKVSFPSDDSPRPVPSGVPSPDKRIHPLRRLPGSPCEHIGELRLLDIMNINDITGQLGPILRLIALALAAAAALKLFGLISIRPGVLELSAVAIALAQVR